MIIYIAGKYTGKTDEEISANIQKAREAAIKIWEAGHVAFCPHLNTAHFERDCICKYEDYIKGDLQLLEKCDAVYVLRGGQHESKGTRKEIFHAMRKNISIYYEENEQNLSFLK